MSAPDWTGPYRDRAVVLRTYRLGEADRIVVLLGQHHGKIRGVAKGVRRTRSRFGSRLEPGSHVDVSLWRGRGDLDTITGADSSEGTEQFAALRADLASFGRAMAMLEAVDRLTLERTPAPELYDRLLRGLRSLVTHPSALSVGAFLWRLAELEGIAPDVGGCVHCGAATGLVALDIAGGGLTCLPCRPKAAVAVDGETVAVLRGILSGGLAEALARPASAATAAVERLGVAVLEQHTERRLRAPALLDAVAASPDRSR
ncbi:MAG: DNA repair protein RecO [bacterium]|nr:DNA repair protein RecO [bacterium]MXZ30397.1 DNA repair protein RecO [Acidimicrobiia bacterium]MDE0669211.1 DNA repair protein RecO [bacterium]MYB23792.1 DNA repair protein RecO [Acidimicrobiia bacterium]MYE68056.1 DNA repair protein RecO [Acidimicrobiia bacterium]